MKNIIPAMGIVGFALCGAGSFTIALHLIKDGRYNQHLAAAILFTVIALIGIITIAKTTKD